MRFKIHSLKNLKFNTHYHYIQNQILSNSKPISKNINFFSSNCLTSSKNWSEYIRNCIYNGQYREALLTYTRIRRSEISILGIYPLLIKACALLLNIKHGNALHADSIKLGIICNVVVGTSFVNMYAKCGCSCYARNMFDKMPHKNIVTWNAMIGGYMKEKDTSSAIVLFEKMNERTAITWIEMIVGFSNIGDMVSARKYFDRVPMELRTVVTWTAMVDGFARNDDMPAAKDVFEKMPIRNNFVWSSMIMGYCKKGDVKEAKRFFDTIPNRNLVNWNSLISGFAQNGYSEEALCMLTEMQREGFEPDEVTLVSVLSACGQLGLLDRGKEVHLVIIQRGFEKNQFISNGLVDMYGKCGDLCNARMIFEKMPKRNDSCWNSMISGFASHGKCEEALEYFQKMERSDEKPNDITFLAVLSACSHGGLVQEGLGIFAKMEMYGLTPGIKHYGCIIDLLGRAARLKEAYNLIKSMPMKPSDTIWGSLLGACRVHLNTDMVEIVLKDVSGDKNSGYSNDFHYVLLSNIYAASDKWEKAERMRIMMVDKGLLKIPGRSSFMWSNRGH